MHIVITPITTTTPIVQQVRVRVTPRLHLTQREDTFPCPMAVRLTANSVPLLLLTAAILSVRPH